MMSQCRACKHCVVYKSEFEFVQDEMGCKALINVADIDFYEPCSLFEPIKNKEKYIESDMACDICDYNRTCNLVNVSNIWDERTHYYDVKGNYCYTDNEDFGDFEDDFD